MHEELPRVLLIDDSLDELRVLSDMLRSERFRLLVATDGRQGYQRAVTAQPDVILMDVVMPQMDGLTACRMLKVDPATRAIPVIFLSAKIAPHERLQGLRAGGIDYVSKPFLEEEVIVRVRIHLNRTRRPAITAESNGQTAPLNPTSVIARAAAALIEERLSKLPSVDEIASLVGTHQKKLTRIFREEFNMTILTFIKEERIRVASQLLTQTDMPVYQIGEQVGINNPGNFSTAFRERMGLSPSDYREATRTSAEETV